MVLDHDPLITKEKQQAESASDAQFYPAPRLDRIAAAVVDGTIIFSVSKVFAAQAIFALRVSSNFNLDQSLFASLFNIIWLTFSVFITYKLVTYKMLGRTLGQMFFSLNISNFSNDRKIDQYTLILRSFLSFLSIFLIFPVISILVNKDGRTFYDKICETVVLTSRSDSKRKNSLLPIDKLLGSSFILIIFAFMSYASLYLSKNTFRFQSDFIKNSRVCSKITDFHKSWTRSKIEESRIDVALALYSAGELSTECLSTEIDFEFSIDPLSSTAYLAKGLLSIENDKNFIRYFRKTCELNQDSPACVVASWMSFWPNYYEGEKQISDFNALPTYARIWAIKRNYQKGNVKRLSDILSKMEVSRGLEGFYTEHLMRVETYNLKNNNFENILKVVENKKLRVRRLTEAYCGIAIGKSCENYNQSSACSTLKINRSTDKYLQNMLYACQGQAQKIFDSESKHEEFYIKFAKKDSYILNDLKSIFMNTESSFPLRFATMNVFFGQVSNPDYLKTVKVDWENQENKDYFWRLIGENLKDKFNSLNDMKSAFLTYKVLSAEFLEIRRQDDFIDSYNEQIRFPAQIHLDKDLNSEAKGD